MSTNGKREKCPDFDFCEKADSGCYISRAAGCLPKERVEAGSILYISIFRLLSDKGSFKEDDREIIFLKNLFLNSGGKEAEMKSIMDKAVGSFLQRSGRIKHFSAVK